MKYKYKRVYEERADEERADGERADRVARDWLGLITTMIKHTSALSLVAAFIPHASPN